MDDHIHALRRIMRYIQDTCHYELQLYPSSTTLLIDYINADWDNCPDIIQSTSAYSVFFVNNFLSLSFKRHCTLSHFGDEVEYEGVANVVNESCWVCKLLLELHCLIPMAT